MVHLVKLNWAKKFEIEHSEFVLMSFCTFIHVLWYTKHTYLYASQELHH